MNNTELATSIKILGAVPENQDQFSAAALLNLATEEMNERMLPFMFMLNQGSYDYPFQIPVVAGTRRYYLSSRASYGTVRDLSLVYPNTKINLIPIDPTLAIKQSSGPTMGYYFQQSRIVLDRPPAVDGVLEYTARIRPSRLTETTYSAIITAFDPILRTITIDQIPTAFTAGYLLDTVKGKSAFDLIDIDNAILSVDTLTNTLTMTRELSIDVSVGDYVSPAGSSAVPQLHEELHSTLSMMTASRCLFSLGQLDQKAALDERIMQNLQMFKLVMSPRGRGEGEIAISPYFNF